MLSRAGVAELVDDVMPRYYAKYAYLRLMILYWQKKHILAKQYYDRGEYDRAIPLLQLLAQYGDPRSHSLLACCYKNGLGVTKDLIKAQQYYLLASTLGGINFTRDMLLEYGKFLLFDMNAPLLARDTLNTAVEKYRDFYSLLYLAYSQVYRTEDPAIQILGLANYERALKAIDSLTDSNDLAYHQENGLAYYQRAIICLIRATIMRKKTPDKNRFAIRALTRQATDFLVIAHEKNHNAATFLLGILSFYGGHYIHQNQTNAAKYFNKIAENDNTAKFFFLFLKRRSPDLYPNYSPDELTLFARDPIKKIPLAENNTHVYSELPPLPQWSGLDYPDLIHSPEHTTQFMRELSAYYTEYAQLSSSPLASAAESKEEKASPKPQTSDPKRDAAESSPKPTEHKEKPKAAMSSVAPPTSVPAISPAHPPVASTATTRAPAPPATDEMGSKGSIVIATGSSPKKKHQDKSKTAATKKQKAKAAVQRKTQVDNTKTLPELAAVLSLALLDKKEVDINQSPSKGDAPPTAPPVQRKTDSNRLFEQPKQPRKPKPLIIPEPAAAAARKINPNLLSILIRRPSIRTDDIQKFREFLKRLQEAGIRVTLKGSTLIALKAKWFDNAGYPFADVDLDIDCPPEKTETAKIIFREFGLNNRFIENRINPSLNSTGTIGGIKFSFTIPLSGYRLLDHYEMTKDRAPLHPDGEVIISEEATQAWHAKIVCVDMSLLENSREAKDSEPQPTAIFHRTEKHTPKLMIKAEFKKSPTLEKLYDEEWITNYLSSKLRYAPRIFYSEINQLVMHNQFVATSPVVRAYVSILFSQLKEMNKSLAGTEFQQVILDITTDAASTRETFTHALCSAISQSLVDIAGAHVAYDSSILSNGVYIALQSLVLNEKDKVRYETYHRELVNHIFNHLKPGNRPVADGAAAAAGPHTFYHHPFDYSSSHRRHHHGAAAAPAPRTP